MSSAYDRLLVLAGLAEASACPTCGHAETTLSMRQIAPRLGVSTTALQNLKTDHEPNLATIRKIAAALGRRPSQVVAALWPEEPDAPAAR